MRIMTYNIQHGLDYRNNKIDLPLFAEEIRSLDADICGLNEIRGEGTWDDYTDQIDEIADCIGYNRYFAEAFKVADENPYGNGIVSRLSLIETETVPIPTPESKEGVYYEPRCILRAVIEDNERRICVLVCHMGLSDEERASAVNTICDLLDSLTVPVILMGDFNTVPNDKVLKPLFERLSDTDSYAEESGKLTYATYNPEMKIDYILFRGLKCKTARVVDKVLSDHFPVIADFD